MDNKPYVFISYSRQDETFVNRLASDLRNSGIQIWRDIEEISAGSNWVNAIEMGIKRASVFLYISSKNSIKSIWMGEELKAFYEKGGFIIPVVIDDEGASHMPSYLEMIQWADFRSNYDKAFRFLLKSLEYFPREEQPIKSKKKKSKGYVFLSYAEEDTQFVKKLRKFLKDRGYAYWDYAESDRDYHTQLFLELEGIINEAVATLSILSPDWKRSKWTVREYFYSEDAKIPVFLLKVRELGPTLAIAGIPYIDFVNDPNVGFSKLVKELKRKGL